MQWISMAVQVVVPCSWSPCSPQCNGLQRDAAHEARERVVLSTSCAVSFTCAFVDHVDRFHAWSGDVVDGCCGQGVHCGWCGVGSELGSNIFKDYKVATETFVF
jgi:hypothetical protein